MSEKFLIEETLKLANTHSCYKGNLNYINKLLLFCSNRAVWFHAQ